jgi:hypothetical protein
MIVPSKRNMQKTLIVIGIAISIIGLSLHFAVSGTSRSGWALIVDGSSSSTRNIAVVLGGTEFQFSIEILGPELVDQENTSTYLVTASEYARFLSGVSIDDLDALLHLTDEARGTYEVTASEIDLYLIAVNENTFALAWGYYYVVLPPNYFQTLIFGFAGIFIANLSLAWFLSGWKRWLSVGITVNLALFFVRIFTLANYSLGLPDIFIDLIHVELYNDYQFFYLGWVPNLLEGTWAYSDGLANYLYPPLWIYTVSIFGNSPSWLPGIPLFALNVATGYLVYVIVKVLSNSEKRSILAMMFYLLNPFTLFYGSFMWLNPTPFVFFTLLSFYLALKNMHTYSIATIAIATLYKQLAVVFFPILVILLIRRERNARISTVLSKFLKSTLIYTVIIGIVSLPFLIVSPDHYLNQMLFANTGNYERLRVFIPDLWMPVHLNTFFLWIGAPVWFTDIIAWLLINYIFLGLCGIIVYGLFAKYNPETVDSENAKIRYKELFTKALLWGLVAVICIQLFYPRGAYKFYLLALSPFLAILFDYKDLQFKNESSFVFKKHHLFPLVMSWLIFACYRFVYFWLVGALVLIYLWKSGEISRIVRIFKLPQEGPDRAQSSFEMEVSTGNNT